MSVRERPPSVVFAPPPPKPPRREPERFAVPTAIVLLLVIGAVLGIVQTTRGHHGQTAGHASGRGAVHPPSAPSGFGSLSPEAPLGGPGNVRGRLVGAPPAAATLVPPAAIALDSGWKMRHDRNDDGLADGWGEGGAPPHRWTSVTIPNDFNPVVKRSGYNGQVWWYETTFTGPRVPAGRSWDVTFESVRRNATVFLNGREIGTNTNPYAPFSLRASTLRPGQPNTLIVRVDDVRGSRAFPEDWWNWGGITGPVSLTSVGQMAIEDLGVMPRLGCSYTCGALDVTGTVVNTTPSPLSGNVAVRVVSPSGRVLVASHAVARLAPGGEAPLSLSVNVPTPELWSPARPALYAVDVRADVGASVAQDTRLDVGMRSAVVHDGILYLNGQRLWLHGAAIHEDMPGHGAALTDADIRTIVGDLKALGANITRAHYQLSPRLLDALDRAGIMVWAQPPVDHADKKLRTVAGRAQALGLLHSTLIADRNHPSVIIDSVGNELSPTPDTTPGTLAYLRSAIALARRLNPGVPVALDTYCYTNYPAQQIYKQLDVLGISDYFGWYAGSPGHSIASLDQLAPFLEMSHARYPGQAIVVAEWGAEAFYAGPASTKGTYEFQNDYIKQTYAILDQLPFLNGQIYWILRDFAVAPGWKGGAVIPPGYVPSGLHHKGLLSYTGVPKPGYAMAQQLFNTVPAFVSASAGAQGHVAGSHTPSSVLGGPG